jgi:hypothetical protein
MRLRFVLRFGLRCYFLGLIVVVLASCSAGTGSAPAPQSPQSSQRAVLETEKSSLFEGRPFQSLLPQGMHTDLSPGFAEPDAGSKTAVIASDIQTNDVYAFTSTGVLVATITGFMEPEGMALDASGNIYIANTYGGNVPVYESDYKTPKPALQDPNEYPGSVAVDAATGIVAVNNLLNGAQSKGSGNVSFYAKGTTSPCAKVFGDSQWDEVQASAFDAAGNLYVVGNTSPDSNGNVRVLVGIITSAGCDSKTKSLATLNAPRLTFPGGVSVTPKGKIVICDPLLAEVFTYNPPVKGSLGSPIATTQLVGANRPIAIAFNKSASDIWTAEPSGDVAAKYSYPSGGNPITQFTGPLIEPNGIAVTPLEQP